MRIYSRIVVRPLSALLSGALMLMPITVHGQPVFASEPSAFELPSPLSLADAVQAGRNGRAEITAASFRAAAARERGAIVSALEDPMLMTSVDHYPWSDMNSGRSVDPMTSGLDPMFNQESGRRLDWSIAVEQRFPLSPVRSYQRRGADAEARRLSADSERVALDVELQAAEAFLMLHENRRMLEVLAGQLVLADQMIDAADARAATNSGAQVDLLRAEVEAARLQAQQRSLQAEERATQAMLNMSIGRQIDAPIPALVSPANISLPQASIVIVEQALAQRPELQSGQAEIDKADAEVDVMRSMYRPMAVVRLGVASTMAEGSGGMAMLGVSVPLWRSKLRAGVSEAQAMESMARADLVAMQQMVRAEVLGARENVIAARETYIALRDEVVPRAQMAVRPSLASFSSGTGALTTVIEAIKTQWAVEAELVMAETNLALSWVRLNRVSGNLPGLTMEQSQ